MCASAVTSDSLASGRCGSAPMLPLGMMQYSPAPPDILAGPSSSMRACAGESYAKCAQSGLEQGGIHLPRFFIGRQAVLLDLRLAEQTECIILNPSATEIAVALGGSYGRGAMVCRSGEGFNGSWRARQCMRSGDHIPLSMAAKERPSSRTCSAAVRCCSAGIRATSVDCRGFPRLAGRRHASARPCDSAGEFAHPSLSSGDT
jgi:hypothetical protein